MAIEIDMGIFDRLLRIQKERKKHMDELSISLGVDISFSDEEVMKFAMEEYEKHVKNEINKEVQKWMKSLYS